MRGWLVYVLSIVGITCLICVAFWILQPLGDLTQLRLSFPVPVSFAIPHNDQVTTLDVWSVPEDIADTTDRNAPAISARAALVYDVSTSTVLFAKNATEEHPMASLTKIMTAIVALEHLKTDDTYIVRSSSLVGEDSMGLENGEALSLSDLLYGLMLHSGNDAAEVLADNFPTGRAEFIKAMNRKVATLGLSHTHFTNPTGLEGDGNQYTTALDLLSITRYGLFHFPSFRQTVATFDYTIPQTPTHKAYFLENETNLLTSYPGVKGVKTGYTPEAGLCLVTYLDYSGHKIIGIILDSNDRRDDMKDLLDYSLKKAGITPPIHG